MTHTPIHPSTSATAQRLNFESVGQGPVLVLVAGLGGLGRFWRPVAQLLAHDWRVLSFDHPGVGGSPSCGPQRIEGITAAVLQLLDELQIDRFSCVGHSTGGLVAQALGLDAPDRIQSLVMSSTWARPDRRFRDLFELRRVVLERAGEGAYAALGQLLGHTPAWYEQALAQDAMPEWTAGSPAQAELIAARIDMLLGYQRADELGNITAPTLIVGASDDQIVPFHHAQELSRRMPHAQLLELSGGHFVPATRPADYADALNSFLKAHV
jgi:aminoacrylate hydrolase